MQEAIEVKPDPIQDQSQKNEETRRPETNLIPIDSDGRVMARNNSELLRYCGALVAGDGVPKRFDSPQKLFAALMFVRDLKLPDTSIRQVANIHGTMAAFGDLPLALVQRTKELSFFQEQWFDEKYEVINFEKRNLHLEPWGAVCFASRGPENNIQSFSFTLADAKKAGLFPANVLTPWHKYTRLMLRYKARSIALKSLFADSINGLAIAEYDFDMHEPDGIKDVTPEGKVSALQNKIDELKKLTVEEDQSNIAIGK